MRNRSSNQLLKLNSILIWPMRGVGLIALLIVLYLGGIELFGRIPVNQGFSPAADGVTIFVTHNGIHTDIAVPVHHELKDWSIDFPISDFRPPVEQAMDNGYLSFGWGDKGLYENVPTWDDLTVAIAAESLLWPTQSAMHVTYFRAPLQPGPAVRAISISEAQYAILINEIEQSFTRGTDGRPISLDCCWYDHISDNFYASGPSYHLFRTCNNWTNRLLKETGVPTALWTPRYEHIFAHLP